MAGQSFRYAGQCMAKAARGRWPRCRFRAAVGPGTGSAAIALVVLGAFPACSARRPEGERSERERLESAGEAFRRPFEERELPDLDEQATLDEALRHAFHANAELERAWFEWRAAMERIPQAVSLDQPRLSFEYLFSDGMMSRWDRTTLGLSQMIPLSREREHMGSMALEEAIMAGRMFEDMKFGLQATVVGAWSDLVAADRMIAVAEDDAALAAEMAELVRGQVSVGMMPQVDATRMEFELRMTENALEDRRAERPAMLAMLNALLSRPPLTSLVPAPADGRPAPPEDDDVLALVAERNPSLQALAAAVRGRQDALRVAKSRALPDLEIGIEIMGNVERMLMGMVTLPLRREGIRAGVDEARAMVRAARAELRARHDDVAARVVLELALARNAERQIALVEDVLLPRAHAIVEELQASYGTGRAGALELLDARRTLLELRMMEVEARATYVRSTAQLEALCAVDFAALEELGQ